MNDKKRYFLAMLVLFLAAPVMLQAACVEYFLDSNAVETTFNGDFTDFETVGDIVYAASVNQIVSLDYSSGSATLLGSVSVTESPKGITVNNGYAYVACGNKFEIIDISDPSNMSIVATIAGQYFLGSAIYENYLWAYSSSYVYAWDITDPARPSYRGTSDQPDAGYSNIIVANDHVYVVDELVGEDKLVIFDAHPEENYEDENFWHLTPRAFATQLVYGGGQPGGIFDIDWNGQNLFLSMYSRSEESGGQGGIVRLDVDNPLVPVPAEGLIGDLTVDYPQFCVSGNYVYAFRNRYDPPQATMDVFDITEIAQPNLVGTIQISPKANLNIDVTKDQVVWIGFDGVANLISIDRQCDAPVLDRNSARAWMEPTEDEFVNYWHFEWYSNHWTEPEQEAVLILDAPLGSPECYIGHRTPISGDQGVYSSMEYVPGMGVRHHIYFSHGECVSGCNYIWTAQSTRTGQATLLTDYDIGHWPKLTIDMCLGSFDGGLPMKSSSGLPSAPKLESAYPNPFNPQTTIRCYVPEGGKTVTLAIHDVTGKRVRTLISEPASGWNETTWYGRSDDGRQVSSGVYFLKMYVDGAPVGSQKLTLLK